MSLTMFNLHSAFSKKNNAGKCNWKARRRSSLILNYFHDWKKFFSWLLINYPNATVIFSWLSFSPLNLYFFPNVSLRCCFRHASDIASFILETFTSWNLKCQKLCLRLQYSIKKSWISKIWRNKNRFPFFRVCTVNYFAIVLFQ